MLDDEVMQSIKQAEQKMEKLFGDMREATPEENEAIDKYIKSISKPTGINIWED